MNNNNNIYIYFRTGITIEKKVQAFCQKVNEKKASAFGEISKVPNIKLFSGPNHPPITIQFH